MKISDNGIWHLIRLEGYRNNAYKDVKGLWTTGVGHLIQPHEEHLINTVLTNEEVEDLLKADLVRFERVVNETIKVPLTQNQYDSLVSIAFNIGVHGFKNSTFVKRINNKESKERISQAIMMWNKPSQIIGRRKKEVKLYFS